MPFFSTPKPFRLAHSFQPSINSIYPKSAGLSSHVPSLQVPMSSLMEGRPPPHSSHPDFGHLVLLVFEAVLEGVCVSLPGYIVARQGMFNADMQKFAANLNVMLFTPCLSEYSRFSSLSLR